MLLELNIRNFAIIDSVSLSFGPGLNIFTGETGAGKSIIIDAVALILGDRATNDIIRSASDEAQVEALFDVSGSDGVEEILTEAGLEYSDSLVIKRVVQRAGRNRIYINGSLATLMTLTEVGRRLIDIYGQSEHQSLTRPEEHIELLDAFGGLGGLRAEMAANYARYVELRKELDSLIEKSKDATERSELLGFQLKEITDADLKPAEDVELKVTFERLRNTGKIKSAAVDVERALYSEQGSVIEQLGTSIKALKDAAQYDERLGKTVETLETSFYQLEDASMFLRGYAESVEADPAALESIGSRIDLVNRIKKKHGPAIEDVLNKKAALEKELSEIADFSERAKELEAEASVARQKADLTANKLTEERAKAARGLKKLVEEELESLGMEGAVFEVISETDSNPDGTSRFGEKGGDRVRFFISPNPGEEIKPLARIASGGELSRIMLAIKKASTAGRVPSLVFDEIDTGVGGAVAEAVGLKLKEVASAHQVLCITHLPQIAAFADRHYTVSKSTTDAGRTIASIRELDAETAVEEISRMLGGKNITGTTRKHARELLEAARSKS